MLQDEFPIGSFGNSRFALVCLGMYLLWLPCFALVYWPMYLLRYAVLHKYVGLWYVAQVCWPAAFGMLHTNVFA